MSESANAPGPRPEETGADDRPGTPTPDPAPTPTPPTESTPPTEFAPPPDAAPPGQFAPPGDAVAADAYPPPGQYPLPAYPQAGQYPAPAGYPQVPPYPTMAQPPRRPNWYLPERAEIRWAVIVAVGLALLGFAVTAVWLNLAPRLPYQVNKPGEAIQIGPEYETFISDDGWFFVSTLVVGLVGGVLAFIPKAGRGWLMTLALAIGGLAGALITWRTGLFFAPKPPSEALQHVGDIVLYPIKLNATAFLVAEPFAAVVAYVIIAGFVEPDDLRNPADRPPAAQQPAEVGA